VSHEQSLQCAVVRPAADEARRAASLRVTVGRGAEVTLGEVGNRAVGFDPERMERGTVSCRSPFRLPRGQGNVRRGA
jgi:hypothetical protein